jgi:hypothetical protein
MYKAAYIVGDNCLPPTLPDGQKWMLLKFGIQVLGDDKVDADGCISPKAISQGVPSMVLVATDRQSAKKAIMERFDAFWDAWLNQKEMAAILKKAGEKC